MTQKFLTITRIVPKDDAKSSKRWLLIDDMAVGKSVVQITTNYKTETIN
jgi:hypothetical protein